MLASSLGQTFIRGSFDAGKFYGETPTAAFSSAAQKMPKSATTRSRVAAS
jgi:hypothetical protein